MKKLNDYDIAMQPFEQYIREADCRLRSDEFVLVHLDGLNMTHRFLRKMTDEERQIFSDCLLSAAKDICNQMETAILAYVCNDEIALLLEGGGLKKNYHNRIQKLCSILAAKASLSLYQKIVSKAKRNSEIFGQLKEECVFAAKCFNLPEKMVENYFKARLLSCKISSQYSKETQKNWQKYGYLITYSNGIWNHQSLDFNDKKFIRNCNDRHINLN